MKKFYIEASEVVVYKTMVEAEDYHDAQEKFWSIYSDLQSTDTGNTQINFIGESQR